MERTKNKRKLMVVAATIIITTIISISFINTRRINSYISEKCIVYTPNTMASKASSDIISIDTFDYWIFKLNDKQKAEIIKELNNGNWSNISYVHFDLLRTFFYEEPSLEEIIKTRECYICVYDDFNDKIVTADDESVYGMLTQTIIFIFEPSTGYYVCIHRTT